MNELENILKSILESEIVIKSNENFVGMGLWNIGNELKYIRDNKTYTDKGYKSFEDYVENELDYSKRNAYRYIEISEGYNVTSMAQIGHLGMVKLLALSKLDEAKREEFIQINPVDEMTTKELQKAINDKDKAENKLKTYETQLQQARIDAKQQEDDRQSVETKIKALEGALQKEKDNLKKTKENQKEEIAKLQSFIGEAKVSGNDEEVERLKASLQELQNDVDSSALKIDELEAQLRDKPIDVITAEPVIIEKIPQEVEKELQELRKKVNQSDDPSVVKFKRYYEDLQSTFTAQLELIDEIKDINPENHEKFKNAISKLLSKMSERL
jgi:chromosome segregation ATPase